MELHNTEITLSNEREQHMNEIKRLNASLNEKVYCFVVLVLVWCLTGAFSGLRWKSLFPFSMENSVFQLYNVQISIVKTFPLIWCHVPYSNAFMSKWLDSASFSYLFLVWMITTIRSNMRGCLPVVQDNFLLGNHLFILKVSKAIAGRNQSWYS